MKDKKKMIVISAMLVLLLSGLFAGFDTSSLSEVKSIDLVRIFASGMLVGVLLTLVKKVISERKSNTPPS